MAAAPTAVAMRCGPSWTIVLGGGPTVCRSIRASGTRFSSSHSSSTGSGGGSSSSNSQSNFGPGRQTEVCALSIKRAARDLSHCEHPRIRGLRTFSTSVSRRNEGGDFVVTGSLIDARNMGEDSPLPGQFLAVSHAFGPEAVAAFAAHAGDNNPIHLDEEYAKHAGPRTYDGCIVHGLMVAGLFSTAFGRAISGALYVSQSLRFERPVLVGETVHARVQVEQARMTSSGREVLARCSTVASLPDGSVAVSGQAKVLLPRSGDVRSW